jgi:hypothetical protein
MTRYQSGIRTVTVNRWLTCPEPDCGQQTYRSRRFTGPLADQEAAEWQPDPRCFPHLRAAARAAVGL